MISIPKMDVVGALIRDELGRVLACRRPPKDQWSGYWEFPGGKIAEGESERAAVEREILEELSISVFAMDEVARISHRYEDRIVDRGLQRRRSKFDNSWNMICQDGWRRMN